MFPTATPLVTTSLVASAAVTAPAATIPIVAASTIPTPTSYATATSSASTSTSPSTVMAPPMAGLGKIEPSNDNQPQHNSSSITTPPSSQSPPPQGLNGSNNTNKSAAARRIVIVPQRAVNGGLDFKFDSTHPDRSKVHHFSAQAISTLSMADYEGAIRQVNATIKPARSTALDTALLVTGPFCVVPLAFWAVRRSRQSKQRKHLLQQAIWEFNQQYGPELYMKWNKRTNGQEGYLSIEQMDAAVVGGPHKQQTLPPQAEMHPQQQTLPSHMAVVTTNMPSSHMSSSVPPQQHHARPPPRSIGRTAMAPSPPSQDTRASTFQTRVV